MEEEHWDELNTQEAHEAKWVECFSDDGELYYSNVITGETSWTKPESEDQSSEWIDESATGDENANTQFEAAEMSKGVTIAQDSTLNGLGQVAQWLELYDPTQNATYYFSPQSGEIRWELPPAETSFVRHCDSDAVLGTIVALQSATRSQQARIKVAWMRQQNLMNRQQEPENKNYVSSDHEQSAEASEEAGTDVIQSQEVPGLQTVDSQWMEVYDPVTQQQYYYSPRTSETRWDPPDESTASSDDRQVTAAISIQKLSRGRHARKQAKELRINSPQCVEQQFNSETSEFGREALHRRQMNHQELTQLQFGDRFWGLDYYEREQMQKLIEEELQARTQSTSEQWSSTNSQQMTTAEAKQFEDQELDAMFEEVIDPEQLQRELQDEHEARMAMTQEEAQQCHNKDKFWGIQAEEARQDAANAAMAEEEAASRSFAHEVLKLALSVTWEAEAQQNATKELATRGGQEQRMQARYLGWFFRQCVSVDELLDYRWPTKQQQERLQEASSPVKKSRYPVPRPYWDSVESATPYPLDDLITRERLEHGDLRYGLRPLATVHHHSARGTNGTHYEITKAPPECAFDEVIAAKSQLLAEQQLSREERDDLAAGESQEGDLTSTSSVNYRRPRTPDPHIPARFNGVPYKPNQISPTREILSGDHRKLNQLPSLSKAQKIRHLQKAKVKTRAKQKHLNVQPPQIPENNPGSARDRDDIETLDMADGDPRAQFKRQEHRVLSKLFALMDLDESGTVNQNEMRWALQRDAEINALAKTSSLLCLLLKQRTRLEALFTCKSVEGIPESNAEVSSRVENSNELSWEEFLSRCENAYLSLMSEGLIRPDAITTKLAETRSRGAHSKGTSSTDESSDPSTREREVQIIRRVFALLDVDQNGVVDAAEVQRALYSSAAEPPTGASGWGTVATELRELLQGSRALQPMLHQELFMTAFTKFEPLDPRGISEEEFVAFCLEIAHVAAANNTVENVG